MRLFVTFLGIVSVSTMPAAAAGLATVEFLSGCRSFARSVEDKSALQTPDLGAAVRCGALIEGTLSGFEYAYVWAGTRSDICIEAGVSAYQKAKILIKFGDDNPKFLNEPATFFILIAMKDTFSCKAR